MSIPWSLFEIRIFNKEHRKIQIRVCSVENPWGRHLFWHQYVYENYTPCHHGRPRSYLKVFSRGSFCTLQHNRSKKCRTELPPPGRRRLIRFASCSSEDCFGSLFLFFSTATHFFSFNCICWLSRHVVKSSRSSPSTSFLDGKALFVLPARVPSHEKKFLQGRN